LVERVFSAGGGNDRDAVGEALWGLFHPGVRNLVSAFDATHELCNGTYEGVLSMVTGLGQMEESNVEAVGRLGGGLGLPHGSSRRA
jgi:hypothetical protein